MVSSRASVGSLRRRAGTIVERWRGDRPDGELPPGDLDALDVLEKTDRSTLVQRAERLGPVFKGLIRDEVTVCIVGLASCRRFLKDHADALEVGTLDLTGLIPGGFLRAMHGDAHLEYRRWLVRSVRTAGGDVSLGEFEALATAELQRHARADPDDRHRPDALTATMSAIATKLLVRVFFGAPPGSALHASLVDGFRDLGPYGLVWHPQQRQHDAFDRLCRQLRAELAARNSGGSEMSPTCLLTAVADAGELDNTMLGNLIYMVEMGRADIQNFLRWLTLYTASDPTRRDAIANEGQTPGTRSLAEALVLEVLRSDQSERLERRVTENVHFDGFLIPAGTPVRLCMWESHHDPAKFTDPYSFDPGRFVEGLPSNDDFAPFGLDHHQCPFGTLTIQIGTAFVRALCTFQPTLLVDGRPRRGPYHWEASRQLCVDLEPR